MAIYKSATHIKAEMDLEVELQLIQGSFENIQNQTPESLVKAMNEGVDELVRWNLSS